MKDNVENIFKNADFSKGSNHKEELRKSLIKTIVRLLEYYNSNKIKNLAMMNLR